MSRYDWVDESTLSFEERLGLAYCRLNTWDWDTIFGPKPEGFDELPDHIPGIGQTAPCKHNLIDPAVLRIERIIGDAGISWAWWKFELRESREAWERWYVTGRHPDLAKRLQPIHDS